MDGTPALLASEGVKAGQLEDNGESFRAKK